MTRQLLALGLLLPLLGCGRAPVPQAGMTYFWLLTKSDVQVGQCGDDPELAKAFAPIAVSDNTYFTYKVDPTGKKATVQTCTALEVRSCTDQSPPVVFDILGSELSWSGEHVSQVGTSACSLQQVEAWTFTDKGHTFAMEMVSTYALTGDKATCDRVEASVRKSSPNGLGIAGCSVTWTLSGELR